MSKSSPIVLLIEDDLADQEIFKRAVGQGVMRADLHIASGGEEGLDYLHRKGDFAPPAAAPAPDLILLDLNMPGLSGLETLARIRSNKDTRAVPVVVLTTSDSESDVVQSYELGANSYVTKPVRFEEFVRVIGELDEYWFDHVVLPSAKSA